MKRRIVFFTGTRAEYGLMRGILTCLAKKEYVEAHILTSGTHLAAQYGATADEIAKDGLAPSHTVDIGLEDNSPTGICRSMGQALDGYGHILAVLDPALLVVLGDRYESFCAVAAASVLRLPVAHLYGGETTQGAIDEALRHAMTKMSHLHFTACERYRRRVVQMGEDPARVWCVGSTGVENVHRLPVFTEAEVRGYLGIPSETPYVIATYHPVTLEEGNAAEETGMIADALAAREGLYQIFTGANADAGGLAVNEYLRQRAENDPRLRFFLSLGTERYINAIRYSSGVVGNSSSGIGEVPSLEIPVLDIGDRQKGRERSAGVLHCPAAPHAVRNALDTLFSPEFREIARTAVNPLDKPGTSATIADIIADYPLEGILKKKFNDIDSGIFCSALIGS